MDNFRFYSFVAGLYLSPLQCGLQTAHTVSETYTNNINYGRPLNDRMKVYDKWAQFNKTIVILNALNSKGVIDVHKALMPFAAMFDLPLAIFNEDEQSLNGAATACGIVLPKKYYDVDLQKPDPEATPGSPASEPSWLYVELDPDNQQPINATTFYTGQPEFKLINIIKGYRLV